MIKDCMSDTLLLALESSCDETAGALVRNGTDVLAQFVASQIDLHRAYGGVVPEVACRAHMECLLPGVDTLFSESGVTPDQLDAVAVTNRPGLIGALLVGVSAAKALALGWNKPLIGVDHIEGHIAAAGLAEPNLTCPYVALVVSGGHTNLYRVFEHNGGQEMELLASTLDDAAGEAFDKVARAIGLGYPGGPKIDRLAKEGNADAIHFPRAKVEDAPYDFSFSGVKSAVLNYLNGCHMKGEPIVEADVAASFQKAVCDVLVAHAIQAVQDYGIPKLALAGGVASNSALRQAMRDACARENISFYYPSPILCTDNAAMIGAAAYYEYISGMRSGLDLNAVPNLKLGER